MMRIFVPVLVLLALCACDTEVPDSGAGVGFDNFDTYQQQREAQLSGTTGTTNVLPPAQDDTATDTATDTGAETGANTANVQTPVVTTNNPGISDEQSFQAVTARETIASDQARLEAQRKEYKVIAPTALPTRTSREPNIVQFALNSSNRLGESIYRRSNPLRNSAVNRSCAKYASPDQAQEAFLRAGGPERDRLNLDPDGDGFACSWDPSPFRLAVNR